ncbi:hypothetical protein ACFOY4_01760 [Actinomadura syzygii]|uniref:Uncharacterized protein n=1 Tax=Actinomadura syzygii TaxID=1427538 RepID=A0A5D0TRY8_9ACTN|nr:hypothetical protein [Actinomadura syzygii]TYC08534.1 hypothetical protein FXF65_37185 [Actinomadura syzygii]
MANIGESAYSAVAWLPTAAWDLRSFLENAKSYVQTVGGVLLMLLGAAGLVWGGVLLVRKLMGNQQQSHQQGWGQITMLILVGGALGTGGWQLISTVGSGGQTTIEELGGGTVIVQPFDGSNRSRPAEGSP